MPLSQSDVNRSAVMAVVIMKGKSTEELRSLSVQLANEKMRDAFAKQFQAQLAGMLNKTINDLSPEFVRDLTERIHNNVQLKLTLAEDSA